MLLSSGLKISDIEVGFPNYINEKEFFVKIQNPTFDIRNTFNLSFQPVISGQHNDLITNDIDVILFPIIPQYFHNFFEMFTKVIKLKLNGQKFKVVLVFDYNYYGLNKQTANNKTDGVFNFLIRDKNWPGPNSAHIKDFLNYVNVDFICLTVDELKEFRPKSCYLFFDDEEYTEKDDPYIIIDDKQYNLANFLKVPAMNITLRDIDDLRYIFPKSFVSDQKKIFISRKKTRDRKYQFEDELESAMVNLGYENIFLEDMDILQQIKLLQTSSHIVCPYGSALVNACLLDGTNNILAINYTNGYMVWLYHEFFKKYNIPYKQVDIDNNFDPTEYITKVVLDWEYNIELCNI